MDNCKIFLGNTKVKFVFGKSEYIFSDEIFRICLLATINGLDLPIYVNLISHDKIKFKRDLEPFVLLHNSKTLGQAMVDIDLKIKKMQNGFIDNSFSDSDKELLKQLNYKSVLDFRKDYDKVYEIKDVKSFTNFQARIWLEASSVDGIIDDNDFQMNVDTMVRYETSGEIFPWDVNFLDWINDNLPTLEKSMTGFGTMKELITCAAFIKILRNLDFPFHNSELKAFIRTSENFCAKPIIEYIPLHDIKYPLQIKVGNQIRPMIFKGGIYASDTLNQLNSVLIKSTFDETFDPTFVSTLYKDINGNNLSKEKLQNSNFITATLWRLTFGFRVCYPNEQIPVDYIKERIFKYSGIPKEYIKLFNKQGPVNNFTTEKILRFEIHIHGI